MEIFGLLLLSMSLSIDAFTIGTSCALGGIKASWKSRLIICAISVLIMGISIFCGEALARFISQEVAKYIGCGMLCILGIYIIFGSFARNKKPKRKSITLALKPLGITISIIREPSLCDIDKSNTIDSKEACYIGTALSIDSIGAEQMLSCAVKCYVSSGTVRFMVSSYSEYILNHLKSVLIRRSIIRIYVNIIL